MKKYIFSFLFLSLAVSSYAVRIDELTNSINILNSDEFIVQKYQGIVDLTNSWKTSRQSISNLATFIAPSYNIKLFGAQGVGGDDTAAIQSAINSIYGNATFYFPHGNYGLASSLILRKNISFFGEGFGSLTTTNINLNGSQIFALPGMTNTLIDINLTNVYINHTIARMWFRNTNITTNPLIWVKTKYASSLYSFTTYKNNIFDHVARSSVILQADQAGADQIYGNCFEENRWMGGLTLTNTGDSVFISKNFFSCYNTNQVGIDLQPISGSILSTIVNNNVVAPQGVVIRNSHEGIFTGNNVEFRDLWTDETGRTVAYDGVGHIHWIYPRQMVTFIDSRWRVTGHNYIDGQNYTNKNLYGLLTDKTNIVDYAGTTIYQTDPTTNAVAATGMTFFPETFGWWISNNKFGWATNCGTTNAIIWPGYHLRAERNSFNYDNSSLDSSVFVTLPYTGAANYGVNMIYRNAATPSSRRVATGDGFYMSETFSYLGLNIDGQNTNAASLNTTGNISASGTLTSGPITTTKLTILGAPNAEDLVATKSTMNGLYWLGTNNTTIVGSYTNILGTNDFTFLTKLLYRGNYEWDTTNVVTWFPLIISSTGTNFTNAFSVSLNALNRITATYTSPTVSSNSFAWYIPNTTMNEFTNRVIDLAVVKSYTNLLFYINGRLITTTLSYTNGAWPGAFTELNTTNYTIGSAVYSNTVNNLYGWSIVNKALSLTEIQNAYAYGVNPLTSTNVVISLDFENVAPEVYSTISDLTGKGGDGTISAGIIKLRNNYQPIGVPLMLTNTLSPTVKSGFGALWNSNSVLYWITSTKTNLVSDGR